jgi:hypothetical protein
MPVRSRARRARQCPERFCDIQSNGSFQGLRIFVTIASQELPDRGPRSWGGGDDANTIDFGDWMGFVNQAQAASGRHMDKDEWADYVSASVTAEALFDGANGNSASSSWFASPDQTLSTSEWSNAFYKCGGGDGSVTLGDLSRAIGLHPRDVHKVFKFIEDVGDGPCDRAGVGGWFESNSADESQIDSCEWNQLVVALKSFSPGLNWGGISKGAWAGAIAQMVTKYYGGRSNYQRY